MTEDTFATRLKGVLDAKRIMLKQVAEALSVSPSAVHKWTRGGEIEYERLLALARFIGVNWLWLRYGEQAIADLEASSATDPHIKELRQKHLAEIMENEARMKFAQEVSGIVTWEWNVLTDALNYSSNDEHLFGRHIRNMDDFWACVHPDDVARLKEVLQRSLSAQEMHEWEFRVVVDNDTRWISSRATLVRDVEQRPVKMIGVSLDITERRRAEAALRQNEALLAKAQQIAHLGGWYWNIQTDDCSWTDEAYRIFGWAPQAFKVTMERYLASIVEEDRDRIQEAIRAAIVDRQPYRVEYAIALPDGSRREIREEGEVSFDENGRALTMIGASQDITGQKLAELAYRESEERFRAIFEQAAVGIAHIGLDGRWLRANRKLCNILGYDNDTLTEHTFQELTVADDLDQNLALLDSLLAGRIDTYTLEKRFVRKNGDIVWTKVTTSLSRHPATGKPAHLITIVEETGARAG
ncbi:PAS domain-containing protein [Crenobacter sp. SG2305]|uniref:PAS domain-containing protein n=1 Tax=Crenobacter oryzisoli TaxID=3056844 RepID=UPI0025AAF018|nr:PAS domain-containing protein [Crenobacter sp. SG2305]MDN0083737.1 PAS domain-containing protein [Crenobacter sp. SG2305]